MFLELVWVIHRANSKAAEEASIYVVKELKQNGIDVIKITGNTSNNVLPELLKPRNKLPNLVIVLGGDGTVLNAAHHLAMHMIPILSFNVGGNLGFLTHDQSLLSNKKIWKIIINDQFSIHKRMMLSAKIESLNGSENTTQKKSLDHKQSLIALNDFYIRAFCEENSPTCNLELQIDGEVVDQYKGDGLILSTPTGSTAYSMASGGPIVHPNLEAIIVSPICPMSLSSRPIIVPGSSTLIIKPVGDRSRKVKIWQDGRGGKLIEPGESCLIERASHNALMMVLRENTSYYRTLTQKLHWAGSIHAKNI